MLFTTRINNLVTACPKLSRIWIKTGNPKAPLKAVWINESQLSRVLDDAGAAMQTDDAAADLAEDHLSLAAVRLHAFAIANAWRSRLPGRQVLPVPSDLPVPKWDVTPMM